MQYSATLAFVLAVSFGLVSAVPNVARQATGPGAPCGSGRGLVCNNRGQCVTTDGFNSVQDGSFPECANSAQGQKDTQGSRFPPGSKAAQAEQAIEDAQAKQDAEDAQRKAAAAAAGNATGPGAPCGRGRGLVCNNKGQCVTTDGFNSVQDGNFPECQ